MLKLLSGLSLLLVVVVGTAWAIGWIEVRLIESTPATAPASSPRELDEAGGRDPSAEPGAQTGAEAASYNKPKAPSRSLEPDESTVEGEILRVDPTGSFLVLAIRRGPEEQRFELHDDATVRIDGQPATVSELATGDIARLQLSEASDPSRVVSIEVDRP